MRALTLASALTLFAGAAFAQSYPLPQDYPPAGQTSATAPGGGYGGQSSGYGQGPASGYGAQGPGPDGAGYGGQGGYGAPGYGQGGGGHDPQARALRHQMRAACATDISTYCADASQGGHGAMHQCLMANQARLSPACQGAMGALRSYNQQKRANGGAQGYAPSYGQPPGGAYPPPAPSPQ